MADNDMLEESTMYWCGRIDLTCINLIHFKFLCCLPHSERVGFCLAYSINRFRGWGRTTGNTIELPRGYFYFSHG